ncbi:MAG: type II secretory pathway predicted ATPase ExeA [Desulforhopalus sp.]|jgi:type II secretory pathway predicted ATPase ExeA
MVAFKQPTAQYLNLYGFSAAPFGLSPDPDFFYPAPTHLSAGKILSHAIKNGEGFMVLTGKAGLGKTLIQRRLLEDLDSRKIPLLILSPAVDATGLLQLLLGELGLEYCEQTTTAQLLQIFQNQVLKMAEEDRELFIIVDEAQNMPIQTLEQLRMLSNLETGKRKLMQILLIGQTGLENVLTNPELGQLVQRIVVQERLQPLHVTQVAHYVAYRLQRAGGKDIFLSTSGCRLLHKASQGIPRLINRIMDRALLLASLDATRNLSRRHIQTAITTMKDINTSRLKTAVIGLPLALATLCILITAFTYFFVVSKPNGVLSRLGTTSPASNYIHNNNSIIENFTFSHPPQGTDS